MKVLVTGGAGYIGSTICSALEDRGHTPIILDNLSNGPKVFTRHFPFFHGDIADRSLLERLLNAHPEIAVTIHCAALIKVPESVAIPDVYYRENVAKSLAFFTHLKELGQKRVLISSTGSLYGTTADFQVNESSPLAPNSPYSRSKFMMETILKDMAFSCGMEGIALRYFNLIGVDPKMRTGIYDRHPSHVINKLVEVALGRQEIFTLTGTEWPTRDGSAIKDYFHVWDLAEAHVLAAERFSHVMAQAAHNWQVVNIGSGNGSTVREIVSAFEEVWGKTLPKKESKPRPGDDAGQYASTTLARELLGWTPQLSIQDGIRHALQWFQMRKNMLGYE